MRHARAQALLALSAGHTLGDRPQGGQPRSEQVLPTAGADERLLGGEEEGRTPEDGHLAGAGGVSKDEVLVESEAEDVAGVQPLHLHTLELARNARVETD